MEKYAQLLTITQKMCYDYCMEENTLLINKKIGQNLTLHRKRVGLTQAELAEKINYSDKSVSKWESGGGAPDIYVLLKLAEIFGITVNELVLGEPPKQEPPKKRHLGLHLMIMALSSGIVWLIATCIFVILNMIPDGGSESWAAFIFALPVNAIVLLVFSGVWKYKRLNFITVTLTIWTTLLTLFILLKYIVEWNGSAWLVFLLGVPLQVLEVLWAFFRYSIFKKKHSEKKE